ncbi:MAG TPA: HAD family hydrolase [Rhizomicrobium sp.]|jgi:FkbH-like protein
MLEAQAPATPSLLPWRAPLSADWIERWTDADGKVKALAKGEEVDQAALAIALRRLANQQLGPREQVKLENLASRLGAVADKMPALRRFKLGLIGNRTLDFLARPLRAAGLARGLLLEVFDAPYDAVASFAYGPSNPFSEKLDAVAVLLDEGAFQLPAGLLDRAAEDAALNDAEAMLRQIAGAVRAKTGGAPLIATLPSYVPRLGSSDIATPGSAVRFAARLNQRIADGALDRSWIAFDMAELASRVGANTWHDPVRFHEAKTTFALTLYPLAADRLCSLIAAMCGKSGRALVLDLDNTLWGGVIGDDGVAGIRLGQNSAEGEAYVAFQRFVHELRKRGIVVAVCSKNNDEIAREPFKTHPEMLLREEHIAVFQANWTDKATNIRTIAETLNLGLESFVFVDDNPAERARVRQELPLVAVPEVGDDPSYFPALVAASGYFDHLVLNAEDLGRAQSYESNARRAEIRATVGNYEEYLASLKMTMAIARFDDVGRARIAQLISKSNQFNLTTKRYNEEDVRALEEDRDNILCWQVRLDDAFSAHGMIAVVVVRKDGAVWNIDTWLQSCRVLERGVEETVMNHLFARAAQEGAKTVKGEYVPSPRNAMVADFYDRMGLERVGETDGVRRYTRDVADYKPHNSAIAVTVKD